jgi:hypothetical protein
MQTMMHTPIRIITRVLDIANRVTVYKVDGEKAKVLSLLENGDLHMIRNCSCAGTNSIDGIHAGSDGF